MNLIRTLSLAAAIAGVCTAPALARPSSAVVIGCSKPGSGHPLLNDIEQHPRNCSDPALGGTTAGLQAVRWQDWGQPLATGSGLLVDGLGFEYPAKVIAFDLTQQNGMTFYARVHVVSEGENRGGAFRPGLDKTVSVVPNSVTSLGYRARIRENTRARSVGSLSDSAFCEIER